MANHAGAAAAAACVRAEGGGERTNACERARELTDQPEAATRDNKRERGKRRGGGRRLHGGQTQKNERQRQLSGRRLASRSRSCCFKFARSCACSRSPRSSLLLFLLSLSHVRGAAAVGWRGEERKKQAASARLRPETKPTDTPRSSAAVAVAVCDVSWQAHKQKEEERQGQRSREWQKRRARRTAKEKASDDQSKPR